MITKPGIYTDVDVNDYFADPCPQPSLTQSIAKVMLEQSPLHAWYQHPRLNPDYRQDDDKKYDIGNISHRLLIGRGRELEVIEADDWRTKAAQEKRRAAAAEGRLAVLGRHLAKATKMVEAARVQLAMRDLGNLFIEGSGEVVLAWQEGDIWLRSMVDWLIPSRRTIADYKTTEMCAAPAKLGAKMLTDGWHIQAAMFERGLNAIDPTQARRRDYFFCLQESTPPFALTVAKITEAPLTLGRKQLQWAVDQWSQCMAANVWPGYPIEIERPEFPAWAEAKWLARELEEEDERRHAASSDVIMAG